MCIFHLMDDHDGSSCLEMVRHAQILSAGEVISELGSEGDVHGQPSDSGIHFLE